MIFWKARESGGHRAGSVWTLHAEKDGYTVSRCGLVASDDPFGVVLDGSSLQGEKKVCKRCFKDGEVDGTS